MKKHHLSGVVPGVHTRKCHQKDCAVEPLGPPLSVDEVPTVSSDAHSPVHPVTLDELISFTVNGVPHTVSPGPGIDCRTTLASFLRDQLCLTGTKIGCNEGGCGACTVMITRPDSAGRLVSGIANACLRPLFSVDGAHIVTIEGTGSSRQGFGPVQKKLAECNGSQCGYCTPGFVMAMNGLLAQHETVSAKDVETRFQGNLCRCTGYRSIYKAMHSFVNSEIAGDGTAEAKSMCSRAHREIEDLAGKAVERVGVARCIPRRRKRLISSNGVEWLDAASLEDVVEGVKGCLGSGRSYTLVAGNTSPGVAKYYPGIASDEPSLFIHVAQLPELTKIVISDDHLELGAAVTLTAMINSLNSAIAPIPLGTIGRGNVENVVRHLGLVAHHQVRDVASWAGNLMLAKRHADFASDVALLLSITGASLVGLSALTGERCTLSVLHFMSPQYKLPSDLVLLSLNLPLPSSSTTIVDSFKVMSRHANTHALVNAAFRLELSQPATADGAQPTIATASVLLGNIAQGPLQCTMTQSSLCGLPLAMSTFFSVLPTFSAEIADAMFHGPNDDSAHFVVASAAYRQSVAESLLFKFMISAVVRFEPHSPPHVDSRWLCASRHYERPISAGRHSFPPLPPGFPDERPVGEGVEKVEGATQASGEVLYTADLPRPTSTLYGAPAVVGSGEVGKTITSIDARAAMGVPGVAAFVSARDIAELGGSNELHVTPLPGDPPQLMGYVFATGKALFVGQFVGMVLASSLDVAVRAAKLVKVNYASEEQQIAPIELTTAGPLRTVIVGPHHGFPPKPPPTGAPTVSAKGQTSTTGQKHFFLETQTSFAQPAANGQLVLHTAAQSVEVVRATVAAVLGVRKNKVSVTTTQLGGAYGGKAFLPVYVAASVSVAAVKLNRPVLCQLDRNIDMLSMGGRPPAAASFSLQLDTSTRKLTSLELTATVDCGLSTAGTVPATSLNCYIVGGAKLSQRDVTSAAPLNTIMRAPGDFQGVFFMEAAMEAAARAYLLNVAATNPAVHLDDARDVQEANMDAGCAKVWAAAKQVDAKLGLYAGARVFNASNRWRKRGVWTMATKYAMNNSEFGESCVVNVLSDGSITLDHTGVEMGQGLNTKAIQAVAFELGSGIVESTDSLLPLITKSGPTTTDSHTSLNQTATWGSGTSESVVFACIDACKKINARLVPYKRKLGATATWEEVVAAATADKIPLTESGYKRFHVDGGDYSGFSSCVCVAEIDVLTGEVEILRTDIFYDAGVSLNPEIDVGQIEGSFVQSMGALLLEQQVRSAKDRRLINNGTWDYKVPCSLDVPQVFNVTLMPNDINTAKCAVLGSKASGEPAYMLGACAFFAVKSAIYAARQEVSNRSYFDLHAPATPDNIQMLCLVDLSHLHSPRQSSTSGHPGWFTSTNQYLSNSSSAEHQSSEQCAPLLHQPQLLAPSESVTADSVRRHDSDSDQDTLKQSSQIFQPTGRVVLAAALFAVGAICGALAQRYLSLPVCAL